MNDMASPWLRAAHIPTGEADNKAEKQVTLGSIRRMKAKKIPSPKPKPHENQNKQAHGDAVVTGGVVGGTVNRR